MTPPIPPASMIVPPGYIVLSVDVSAALNDFQIADIGAFVNSLFIGTLPAAVALQVRFGNKQYIPGLVQGNSLKFDPCVAETEGVFITTTGVSATRAVFIMGTLPGGIGVT
jgi:hypothetical protein